MRITVWKRKLVERAVRQFLDDMTPEFGRESKKVKIGYILRANHYFAREKLLRQDAIDLVSEYYDEYE